MVPYFFVYLQNSHHQNMDPIDTLPLVLQTQMQQSSASVCSSNGGKTWWGGCHSRLRKRQRQGWSGVKIETSGSCNSMPSWSWSISLHTPYMIFPVDLACPVHFYIHFFMKLQPCFIATGKIEYLDLFRFVDWSILRILIIVCTHHE